MVDQALGPVLAQGSTATRSLTRRAKPSMKGWPTSPAKWEWQLVLYMLIMAHTCKVCMNIPAVHLCADRVRCQPVVSTVTESDVNTSSNSVSAQCKLKNIYYLATVILGTALWLDSDQTWFFAVTWFWHGPEKSWLNPPLITSCYKKLNFRS